MADINIRLKAEALGKDLEDLSYEVQQQIEAEIQNVARMGYDMIVASAQTDLQSSRQDYLSGLKFHTLGPNEFLIVLEGQLPNSLEAGYPGFDIREGMLKSKKIVEVGSRAGLPWVQKARDGHKYAHVPFEHRPFSKAAKSSDLNEAIRKLNAINMEGIEQKFTKIFKDPSGNPLEGKVASVREVKGFPNLDGITKYQKKYKDAVQSVYLTYRTVSENGHPWMHKGYEGAHFFDRAEKWLDEKIDEVLERMLK